MFQTDKLTVTCDGHDYEVARRPHAAGTPLPAPPLPAWVIEANGHYIGTFPSCDGETEASVREMACGVIRNGSTSFHPIPDCS